MRHSKLSTLSDDDIDALYDAVLRAPLAIARLAASLPRERFSFALGALTETGLLQLDIGDERIELRAPYAPRSGAVVVRRTAGKALNVRELRRERRSAQRSTLLEPHEEIEFESLAHEFGIDGETLKSNVGAQGRRRERRAHRRR
jgi:hypothetical protein